MAFGLLVVSKPRGPTSHDVVARIRRGTGERRVGHAGTLDPLADGVLVVALGQATRLVEYLSGADKTYEAEIFLGRTTDTYDAEGHVTAVRPIPEGLTPATVERHLCQFRGAILQTPPPHSAIKVKGRPAYLRARAGEAVAIPPRPVTIHELTVEELAAPYIRLRVRCSAGTYIRSLAHEIGQTLGCGAMLSALTRTSSGAFTLAEAVAWDDLESALSTGEWPRLVIEADRALVDTPAVMVDAGDVRRVANGMPFAAAEVRAGLARAYTPAGRFFAVLKGDAEAGIWRPHKVFSLNEQGAATALPGSEGNHAAHS